MSELEQDVKRQVAKRVLFTAIRPLPLHHNWTFWYDRYTPWTKLSIDADITQQMEHIQMN